MARRSVRFGVEFEFVGPGDDCFVWHVIKKNLPRSPRSRSRWDSGWDLGDDGSIRWDFDGGEGLELRTPILKTKDIPQMKPVLNALSSFCVVTKTCGLHVHLSSSDRKAKVDGVAMARELDRKYRRQIWNGRHGYCKKGFGKPADEYDWDGASKYHTVREVNGNHIEVRIFNGTLDYNEVKDRVKTVVALYRKHLKVKRNRAKAKVG